MKLPPSPSPFMKHRMHNGLCYSHILLLVSCCIHYGFIYDSSLSEVFLRPARIASVGIHESPAPLMDVTRTALETVWSIEAVKFDASTGILASVGVEGVRDPIDASFPVDSPDGTIGVQYEGMSTAVCIYGVQGNHRPT